MGYCLTMGEVEVGTRLSYKAQTCTVRYVGTIKPWGEDTTAYGVEWDDPERGKNDGSLQGVRYFNTRVLGAGSFIKATRSHDGLLSFEKALHEKYSPETTTDEEMKTIRVSLSKMVESVGMEKVRRIQERFEAATNISLARMCVNTCTSGLENLVSLKHLDLSGNLFTNWAEVIYLCQHVPSLQSLVLNGNRFSTCSEIDMMACGVIDLSLQDTMATIEDLKMLAPLFPKLGSLNLARNMLSDLNPISSVLDLFPHLHSADLSYNAFTELPSLNIADVNVSNNAITTLPKDTKLPNCTSLNLGYNLIDNWESVDKILNIAPNLEALRINGNLFFDSQNNAHIYTLGRIGQITKLNGTTISPQERNEAELYFMSQVAKNKINYNTESSRWNQLCMIHGLPNTASTINSQNTIKSKIIELQLNYNGQQKSLKVLKTNSLQKTRLLISRSLKLNPFKFSLSLNGSPINSDAQTNISDIFPDYVNILHIE